MIAYHGPHVLLTHDEVERVAQLLNGQDDPIARQIRAKIAAALAADPVFRKPA